MNNKKILIVALSLILLFSISCGDRPTGSMPNDGSIPKITGTVEVKLTKALQLEGSGLTVTPAKDDAPKLDAEAEKILFAYDQIGILEDGKTDSDYKLYWKDDGKTIMEGNDIDPETSEVMSYLKITFTQTPEPFSSGITADVEVHQNLTAAGYGSHYIGKNTTPYTVSEAQVP